SVNKHFGALPKSTTAPPSVRAIEGSQAAERRVLMRTNGKKESVLAAYHAPAYGDNDAAAMAVLEKLLNSGTGRLKSHLLDQKICSSAHSTFELKKDPGLFTVSMTAASGVPTSKVLDSWESTLSGLKGQSIPESELRRARNQAEYAVQNDRDGPYGTAFYLGF